MNIHGKMFGLGVNNVNTFGVNGRLLVVMAMYLGQVRFYMEDSGALKWSLVKQAWLSKKRNVYFPLKGATKLFSGRINFNGRY